MTFTVLPFVVVFMAGLLALPGLDIYQINAWNVGTAKTEPWRSRAAGVVRRIASAVNYLLGFLQSPAALACAALVLALVASHLGASHLSGLALIGVAAGKVDTEPTLEEVKTAVLLGNQLFEEFKATNDKRVKALEEGRAVDPLITAKLEKLNDAIDKQSAINEAFTAMQAKFNRLQLQVGGGDAAEQREAELKQFNLATRANATSYGRSAPKELTAEEYAHYKSGIDQYLRGHERDLTENERKALSVGTDPQGGWIVTPDTSGRIVTRVFETSPMRQYAAAQSISTDALEGTADLDEATFGWVGETTARTDSNTPNVPAPWRIPVYEAYSQPNATQKMLEDALVNVQVWLAGKVGDKIGRGFNTAFVTGNGVNKPRGFASYTTAATADATRAWGVFEHVATGSSGAFGTDPNGVNKLLDLVHAMKDVYAANGAFYMNRTTLGKVRQLTDASAAGKYIFVPAFTAATPDTLLGYPVRKLQDMDTYSTASALAIAFGDMKETYLIVDRLGISVLVDPYTNKPYVRFYTRARVGGDVLNFEAMKFLKFI